MSEKEARQVVDAFFKAFNAMDEDGIRATLHFPHAMIAGVNLAITQKPEDFVNPTPHYAQTEGWHHSTLDSLKAVQSSLDKVHYLVEFSRCRADGYKYGTYQGLWILTKIDGRWGIKARSIFPPTKG